MNLKIIEIIEIETEIINKNPSGFLFYWQKRKAPEGASI